MPKAALYTAGVIFTLVSVLHWLRFALGSEISIGGSAFPVSGSLVLGLVAAALAAWMILAGRKV